MTLDLTRSGGYFSNVLTTSNSPVALKLKPDRLVLTSGMCHCFVGFLVCLVWVLFFICNCDSEISLNPCMTHYSSRRTDEVHSCPLVVGGNKHRHAFDSPSLNAGFTPAEQRHPRHDSINHMPLKSSAAHFTCITLLHPFHTRGKFVCHFGIEHQSC